MNGDKIQELPETLPVMVLPGVTLFPNALLPLFIFEPRYRAMLDEALGAGRMLAMAMPRDEEESEVEVVAGVGLVRACVRNDDGTSNLILQGVSRARFTGWEQTEPYRIARIEPLASSEGDHENEDLKRKVTQLHALCARFKEQGIELPSQFEAYLNQITDIGVITDLVASTLVANPVVRQELLKELEIPKRLEKLLVGLRLQLS
ncbi:MAG: LON peptidase substrate-binding domain-containing protein [Verrucomicrobia bacterium]|jgi:Lon protease-like protein|nr:LON peptidase substrate-binding domain-containing protein [Verrucomicrobiota bacterium]